MFINPVPRCADAVCPQVTWSLRPQTAQQRITVPEVLDRLLALGQEESIQSQQRRLGSQSTEESLLGQSASQRGLLSTTGHVL